MPAADRKRPRPRLRSLAAAAAAMAGAAPGASAAPDGERRHAQLDIERLVQERLRGRAPAPAPAPPVADGVSFLLRFPGSVRGLAPGTPVEIRGVPVGAVQSVGLDYDPERNAFAAAVGIELQPDLVPGVAAAARPRTPEQTHAAVDALVRRGLRAQLATTRLLGGDTIVELDIRAGAPPAEILRAGAGAPPEIPTAPSGDAAADRLQALVDRLAQAPIEEVVRELQSAVAGLGAIVNGPELREALAGLRDAAGELRGFAARLEARTDPVLAGAREAVRSADQAADRAGQVLAGLERQLGDRSPLLAQANAALRELSGAARALRLTADYLERHPDALIRGKTDGRR